MSDETQKDPAANPSGDQMRWLPIAIVLVGVAGAAVWGYYFKNTRTQRSGGCAKVLAACKAAGFKRGRTAEERRSFFESCVKPLTEHTKLGDIQIDAESAAACKTRLSRRRQQRDS